MGQEESVARGRAGPERGESAALESAALESAEKREAREVSPRSSTSTPAAGATWKARAVWEVVGQSGLRSSACGFAASASVCEERKRERM